MSSEFYLLPSLDTMKNFSLSLFAFHLYQTLTDSPNETTEDSDRLWDNLVHLGETELPFIPLRELRSHLNLSPHPNREWLTHSQQPLPLGTLPTAEGFNIEGVLQPFRLHDTFAIDLTLSCEARDRAIAPRELKQFQPRCLLPASIQANLGQTIWLYGEVPPSENPQEIARQFAIALLAGTPLDPEFVGSECLFGSPIFEYQTQDNDPAKILRILVSVNNTQGNLLEVAGQGYNWLRDLFWCYHKVCFVYGQARDRYFQAKAIYSQLEAKIQKLPTLNARTDDQLNELNTWLENLPQTALEYSSYLRDMRGHQTALETNTTNYRICLEALQNLGEVPHTWEKFLDTCRQWQIQIQTDVNYLSPAQTLFDQLINAVRGTVEIEQAKRENRLQRWIAFVGIGLAVSNISVQSLAKPFETITTRYFPHTSLACPQAGLSTCFWYLLCYILFHVGIGILSAFLTFLVFRVFAKK